MDPQYKTLIKFDEQVSPLLKNGNTYNSKLFSINFEPRVCQPSYNCIFEQLCLSKDLDLAGELYAPTITAIHLSLYQETTVCSTI